MGNVAKWKKFSKEELQEKVNSSISFRELAGKLGYSKDGGGTIRSLHNMCKFMKFSKNITLGLEKSLRLVYN